MPTWAWFVCGLAACAALYAAIPELACHLLHIGTLYRGNPDERVVALTFDDGPDPRYTPAFLDVLREEGVPATFFLVGERALQHPELVRRITAEGHEVASHSHRHRHHWRRDPATTWLDIARSKRVLEQITGVPVRFHRPPWGAFNLFTRLACLRLRLTPVLWSARAVDWRPDANADEIVQRIVRRAIPGAIVLCHDAGGAPGAPLQTLAALPQVIRQLRVLGLSFTTVGQLDAALSERRSRQRARRRSYPLPRRWLIDFWSLVEFGFALAHRIQPVDAMFRVCPAVWRHGPRRDPVTQRIVIADGTPALDLHIRNDTVITFSMETDQRPVVKALRMTRDGLRTLARLVAFHPEYSRAQVIMAETLMNRGMEMLGFHVEDLPETFGKRFAQGYLRFLLGMYHPDGFRRLRQGLRPTRLKLVWMTREELLRLYGPEDASDDIRQPATAGRGHAPAP